MENVPSERTAPPAGQAADALVAAALAHGIPLAVDAALVEALMRLAPAAAIPRELYAVAAEVIAAVYQADAQDPPP